MSFLNQKGLHLHQEKMQILLGPSNFIIAEKNGLALQLWQVIWMALAHLKWQKFYKSNWELSAARGATVVRYMIEKSVPAPRLLAAGYGDWYPRGIDSVKKSNPMYNPLTLTWEEPVIRTDRDGNEKIMPTVLSLNATRKQKAANRRIQITFINPPHHGKGRSATSYEEE